MVEEEDLKLQRDNFMLRIRKIENDNVEMLGEDDDSAVVAVKLMELYPVAPCTEEEYNEWCEPWNFALILTVLGKKFNLFVLKDLLSKLWGFSSFELIDIPNNYFVVRFQDQDLWRAHYHKVLYEGPWVIRQQCESSLSNHSPTPAINQSTVLSPASKTEEAFGPWMIANRRAHRSRNSQRSEAQRSSSRTPSRAVKGIAIKSASRFAALENLEEDVRPEREVGLGCTVEKEHLRIAGGRSEKSQIGAQEFRGVTAGKALNQKAEMNIKKRMEFRPKENRPLVINDGQRVVVGRVGPVGSLGPDGNGQEEIQL
ncbi:hypothetical protein K1719_005588 [Acacia pycnantha]|nr:hypothetical protein K1719_005588 [Acacia pycnantha]